MKKAKGGDAILRRKQVEQRVGLSRSSIYDMIAKGKFPRPVQLTDEEKGAVGWKESQIDRWIALRKPKTHS